MNSVYEMKSAKSGKVIRFEATYVCEMTKDVVDADGWKVTTGARPTTAGSNLTVYIDGEKRGSCWNPNFWELIDLKDYPGYKKIWGLDIVFTDAQDAAEYDAWINRVMDGGTDDAVKKYRAEKIAQEEAEMIQWAERVVAAAEKQADIPSPEEARRRMEIYNDIQNEGGEGYVPHLYDRDEYNYALELLKKEGRT